MTYKQWIIVSIILFINYDNILAINDFGRGIAYLDSASLTTVTRASIHDKSNRLNKTKKSRPIQSQIWESQNDVTNFNCYNDVQLQRFSTIPQSPRFIIQWRGEGTRGYSMHLRHVEFKNALSSVLQIDQLLPIQFHDALNYNYYLEQSKFTENSVSDYHLQAFSSSMQYITMDMNACESNNPQLHSSTIKNSNDCEHILSAQILSQVAQRCSLIRNIFEILGHGDTYAQLAQSTIQLNVLNTFNERMRDINLIPSWSIRLRQYQYIPSTIDEYNKRHNDDDSEYDAFYEEEKKRRKQISRFGKNKRGTLSLERQAINEMIAISPLLLGKVQLKDPMCPFYILEGLNDPYSEKNMNNLQDTQVIDTLDKNVTSNNPGLFKVFARKLFPYDIPTDTLKLISIASNKHPQLLKVSSIAPKTRICITNTPLCPVDAFSMANLARIQPHSKVLDPFAGSCTTLLACSVIHPTCQTVGIEIAHNGQVNRDDIVQDFIQRNLPTPKALIHGDCTSIDIRNQARMAIQNEPFDAIITDPPYGIREKTAYCSEPPLVTLVKCIIHDRLYEDTPLLKDGGRLVAFVPVKAGDDVKDGMPSDELLSEAGLELCEMQEQPLNDNLSRWLVSYRLHIA